MRPLIWSLSFIVLFVATTAHAFNVAPRIIGGSQAGSSEFPWQVAVLGDNFCGGAIISENYVLTAAHCLIDEDAGNVQVLSRTTDRTTGDLADAESILIHPDYVSESDVSETNRLFDNDIALVKLKTSLALGSDRRDSIKWLNPQSLEFEKSGIRATVSGWGIDSSGSQPEKLQKGELRLSSCGNWSTDTQITENMLCAYGNDYRTDSCSGDSGGALVLNEPDYENVIVGIVSWGPDPCAKQDLPGVYTRVSQYNQWIMDNTGLSEPAGPRRIENNDSNDNTLIGAWHSPIGLFFLVTLGGISLFAANQRTRARRQRVQL